MKAKEDWKIRKKKIRNESREGWKTASHRWVSDRLPPAPGQGRGQLSKVTSRPIKKEALGLKRLRQPHLLHLPRRGKGKPGYQFNKQIGNDVNSFSVKVAVPDLSHRWVSDRLPP